MLKRPFEHSDGVTLDVSQDTMFATYLAPLVRWRKLSPPNPGWNAKRQRKKASAEPKTSHTRKNRDGACTIFHKGKTLPYQPRGLSLWFRASWPHRPDEEFGRDKMHDIMIVQMRWGGWSFSMVALALGMHRSTARRRYLRLNRPTRERYRVGRIMNVGFRSQKGSIRWLGESLGPMVTTQPRDSRRPTRWWHGSSPL
jgi:hypothetical protein